MFAPQSLTGSNKLATHRVAIVTGAARGIGRSIALRLARDGHDVAVADISKDTLSDVVKEVEMLGRKSMALNVDVSNEEEVKNMVDAVAEKLGGIDIMVANAAVAVCANVLNTSLQDFQRVMSTNAQGVFLCYKYAGLKMVEQGRGGRIIGASSTAGKAAPSELFAYAASKSAVRAMTQAAAVELGKHKITVNAYSPGAIDTVMLGEYIKHIAAKTGNAEKNTKPNTIPLGRIGVPEDVAGYVSWLVSEDAGYITGQTINVNGGTTFD